MSGERWDDETVDAISYLAKNVPVPVRTELHEDQRTVDQALDELILATSHLNAVLVQHGMQPVRMPERHLPIQPFFADLIRVIQTVMPVVTDG